MKHVGLTILLLLIFGTTFVGCHMMRNLKVRTEKYTGPQTPEALMEAFDTKYSARTADTKWASTVERSYGEKRSIAFTLTDMDTKYPRDAWLQMLLNKGVTIENFKAYDDYLNIRSDLILKEFYHTGYDWETARTAYIDTQIQEYQLISDAKQANPEVKDWVVLGENVLPSIPGIIYVRKTESGASIWYMASSKTTSGVVKGPELSDKQKSDLLNRGVEPEGWEVVYLDEKGNLKVRTEKYTGPQTPEALMEAEKYTGPQTPEALMEAFDTKYSARTADAKWASTVDTPYLGEKRSIAFTLTDMDTKYPRDAWLQMLLNKGITIENFKAYDGYLNIRSGLISKEFYHTGYDWETARTAYIDTQIQEYQLISDAKQANPEVKDWVVLGENVLPSIPGIIYVRKTESGASIWYMVSSTTTSRNGRATSVVKGPELSEKQKSDLLDRGVEPKGWEVVYLDEKGNLILPDR